MEAPIANRTPPLVAGEDKQPLGEALCDAFRVDYFRQYLGNASLAVKEDGVNLQVQTGHCHALLLMAASSNWVL